MSKYRSVDIKRRKYAYKLKWEGGRCRNIEEFVRSGEYIPIKIKTLEMPRSVKAVVECKPDRN